MKSFYLFTTILMCLLGTININAYKVQFTVFDMNMFENVYGAKVMLNNVEGVWETDADGNTPVIDIPEDKTEGLWVSAYWNNRVKSQSVNGVTADESEPRQISISSNGNFKLKVKAVDENSNAVSGAKVTLSNISGEWTTDENGETTEISVKADKIPELVANVTSGDLEGSATIGFWSQWDASRTTEVVIKKAAPASYKVQFTVFDMNMFENVYGAKIMLNNVEGVWETDADGNTPVIEIPADKAEGLWVSAYWNNRVKSQNVSSLSEEVTEPTLISISSNGNFKLKVKAVGYNEQAIPGAKVTLSNISGEWTTDENGETTEISVKADKIPELVANVSYGNATMSEAIGFWSQWDASRTLTVKLDTAVGVQEVEDATAISTEWYDLNGTRVDDSAKGILIRIETLSDGRSRIAKEIR